MGEQLNELVMTWTVPALIATLVVSLLFLGKAADRLVEEAVTLSLRSGMPPVVVGATVVSLGTTSPEAFVSVLAAFQDKSDLALGNAVGSINCDTGLILGLACLIAPLPINRKLVNRQGWIQFGCGLLLVACCVPWTALSTTFNTGGMLTQQAGFVFVLLLIVYMVWSIRMARGSGKTAHGEEETKGQNTPRAILKMLIAVAVVLVSSAFLIATASELAARLGVPRSVVAATLVAFGTSLPELIIVMTSVMKGQGELAVGNIIGADILNVLFVAGLAAAVTDPGLVAGPNFFVLLFPGMLILLLIFRIGIWQARDDLLSRKTGGALLSAYVLITVLSYVI
jgi:cation:H+ antiporter